MEAIANKSKGIRGWLRHSWSFMAMALILLLAFAPAQKELNPQAYKKGIDKYTLEHIDNFKYYAKTRTSLKPYLVINRSWPDNMVHSYHVLANEKGTVIFAMVEDDAQWGDYAITYRYYFDVSGKTIAFERGNHFYHSACVNNDAINESRIFYYDSTFQRTGQEYSLISAEGKVLDTVHCDFPYNFPYKIYAGWKELKEAEGLP